MQLEYGWQLILPVENVIKGALALAAVRLSACTADAGVTSRSRSRQCLCAEAAAAVPSGVPFRQEQYLLRGIFALASWSVG